MGTGESIDPKNNTQYKNINQEKIYKKKMSSFKIGDKITTLSGDTATIAYQGIVPKDVDIGRKFMYGIIFKSAIGNCNGKGLFYCRRNFGKFVLPSEIVDNKIGTGRGRANSSKL